jgi:hypothetical protein
MATTQGTPKPQAGKNTVKESLFRYSTQRSKPRWPEGFQPSRNSRCFSSRINKASFHHEHAAFGLIRDFVRDTSEKESRCRGSTDVAQNDEVDIILIRVLND